MIPCVGGFRRPSIGGDSSDCDHDLHILYSLLMPRRTLQYRYERMSHVCPRPRPLDARTCWQLAAERMDNDHKLRTLRHCHPRTLEGLKSSRLWVKARDMPFYDKRKHPRAEWTPIFAVYRPWTNSWNPSRSRASFHSRARYGLGPFARFRPVRGAEKSNLIR